MFELQETAHCTQCEGAIPRHCISGNILRADDTMQTVRRVKAYCEHCDVLYQVDSTLRSGVWQIKGEVQIITDRQAKASFIARVEHLRGARKAF